MQLALQERNTSMSGSFKSEHFGIGDEVVIMQILRSKMYSNPIRTICQEIMSNARDAHREVKTPQKPIEVKLPNKLDPSYQVKDYGPGITPERMGNVFIKYGNSTKRETNVQTGGFGLGAKSPFAYSDTFTIVTITDELGYNVRREYIAILDASNLGQLNLFKEEKTEEHTGTTLIVTAKPDDFNSFQKNTHDVGLFWEVQPKIKGKSEFEWEKINSTMKGGNWNLFTRSSWNSREVVALIDGVPYPVERNSINFDSFTDNQKSLIGGLFSNNHTTCILEFGVGRLKVTANREALEYDKQTIKAIQNRLIKATGEMQKFFSDQLKDAKNLWEAHLLLNELRDNFSFLTNNAKWNGITVRQGSTFSVPSSCEVWNFTKTSDDKIKGRRYGSFNPNATSLLYFEDTGMKKPSRPRIQTLFNEKDDGIEKIKVVVFSDSDSENVQKSIEKWKKESHWDLLNATPLSTVEKFKAPRAPRGESRQLAKVREPRTYYNNRHERKVEWSESEENVRDGKGVYVILENRRAYMGTKELNGCDIDNLNDFLKGTGHNLYGIYRRFEKQIGKGWVPVEEILEAQKKNLELKLNGLMNENLECEDRICEELNKILTSPKVFNQIENSDGAAARMVDWRTNLSKNQKDIRRLAKLHAFLGTASKRTGSTLKKLEQDFLKAYPLCKYLHSFGLNNSAANAVVEYVNLMDEKNS